MEGIEKEAMALFVALGVFALICLELCGAKAREIRQRARRLELENDALEEELEQKRSNY